MDRWIELPRLKCLRWIWVGRIKVNYFWLSEPMMPQVTKEEIQQGGDGLVIEGRLNHGSVSQVMHSCKICTAVKKAKWVKPLWYGGQWLKYKYVEAWEIDYITFLKPTKKVLCIYSGGNNLRRCARCLKALPVIPSWALKNKFCGNMTP